MKRKHNDVMERVVLALCESINTPRALSTWLCFKHNQEALLNLPPVDLADNDTASVQLSYFLSEYLSKYKGLKVGIDTRSVALGKWRSAEQMCKETNQRFREYARRPFDGRAENVLFKTQRLISRILGPLNVAKVLSDCKWGPGATFDLRREAATPDNKISQAISVTESAFPYLRTVVQADPHWAACFLGIIPEGPFSFLPSSNFVKFVRGSRFLTVPKSAKTDRCIAAEPTGNSFLQQGAHHYFVRRLRRFGIDLSLQDNNQKGALEAYSSGLSTLDLSAASDTISRELVYHLLPIDWACFLDSLRSHETLVNGEWVRTEKFASMGNAFCFDLETIIFYALSRAVVDIERELRSGSVDTVLVYGDDIIVPSWAADELIKYLSFCGFATNPDKSHIRGNFFESCGKHYHRGIDITPVYQKEMLHHPSEIIRAHNRLVRFSRRLPGNGMLVVSKALRVLSSSYPESWPFPRIPYGVSEDGGFLRPLSEFQLDKNHGYRCRVLDFVLVVTPSREEAMYAYRLRRFPVNSPEYLEENAHLRNFLSRPFNPDPRGYAGNTRQGRWRTRVRWVSEISVSNDAGLSQTID